MKKWFSLSGRIRRKEYVNTLLIAGIVNNILLSIVIINPYRFYVLILSLPVCWVIMAQGVKRAHDLNDGSSVILMPLYGFWLLFADGVPGENRFGLNPKGLELPEKEEFPANPYLYRRKGLKKSIYWIWTTLVWCLSLLIYFADFGIRYSKAPEVSIENLLFVERHPIKEAEKRFENRWFQFYGKSLEGTKYYYRFTVGSDKKQISVYKQYGKNHAVALFLSKEELMKLKTECEDLGFKRSTPLPALLYPEKKFHTVLAFAYKKDKTTITFIGKRIWPPAIQYQIDAVED